MKFRIITSMLLMVFLSLFSASKASAHGGCGTSCGSHHGCWGYHGYYYGPDGCYSHHKAKCGTCCGTASCRTTCVSHCGPRYRRAYYHLSCCGGGHLHCASDCSKSDCSKKCNGKDKDNDD